MELGRYCQHFEVVLTIFDPFFEKVTFLLLFGFGKNAFPSQVKCFAVFRP